MKFLLSLALIVVLASARKGGRGMDLFKPARDCSAEQTEDQVAMTEEKLQRLSDTVKTVCEAQTEEDAEADVETLSARKRGPKAPREVMELLTEERCASAAEDLDAVVAEVHAALDPCQQQLTAANLVEKVESMCPESVSDEDEAVVETEDEAVVGTLKQRKGGKGKGEKRENPLCEFEDVKTAYTEFFSETNDAVNAFEFQQGMNKMKLMVGLEAAHSENCSAAESLIRRLLHGKAGKHRGGRREKSTEDKEEKELPASMQLVADFKSNCVVVDFDSVNGLVTAVQEAMVVEKAAREAEKEQKMAEMEAQREARTLAKEQKKAEMEAKREAHRLEMEQKRAEKETGDDSESEKPTEKRQGGRGSKRSSGRPQKSGGRKQRGGRWGRRL